MQIVFGIDEFQQILSYPEKNTEALLRTQMQDLRQTTFIYCGSNQKMMHQLFNSAKRPFFASCTNIHLDFIEKKKYEIFIKKLFKKHQRGISKEALEFICNWTSLHTFYTQYFCNTLFARHRQKVDLDEVHITALEILKLGETTFYQYRNLLTSGQWNLLKAIAKKERLYHPHAIEFISEHKLGTPSKVSRGLDALLTKDMIYYNTAIEKPYYEVYNKFLMRWLQAK